MSLSKAKEIAKLQGIKFKIETPLICPECNNKCFIMDNEKEFGQCIRCGEKMSADELLRLEHEKEMDDYKSFETMMKSNNGVGGNY